MVSTLRTWAFSSLLLIFPPFASAAIEMHTAIDGLSQTLVLEPNPRIQQEGDPATHYRGHVKDHPESWVRVSQIGGQWSGLLSHRGQLFEVTALSSSPAAARSKQQQVKALQGLESFGSCAAGVVPGSFGKSAQPKTLTFNNAIMQPARIDFPTVCQETIDGVCLVAELSVFFDRSFRAAFPTDYQSRGAEILNIVDGIYQNELNMVFNHLRMDFTNGDQFTSDRDPEKILDDMIARRIQGNIRPSDPNVRSMMHLITARDFLLEDGDTTVVGLANMPDYYTDDAPMFTPVLCSPGYAVATSQLLNQSGRPSAALTAIVVAHELGHNLGMEHDGDPATAATCTSPDRIMYPEVVANASRFSDCSIAAAGSNISALPAVEGCFDFPVDLSLAADSGNILETSADSTHQHLFNVGMQTANGFSGNLIASGRISAGDGVFTSAALAGNSCTVDDASYQCTASSPAALSTLAVTFTTGSEHVTLRHEVSAGADLFDMTSANNIISTTVNVQGPGLRPTNLTLQHDRSRNSIVLRWQDHATDETGYRVEHRQANGGWAVIADDLPADTEEYEGVTSRLVGTNSYRVTALFGSAMSEPSNEASIQFASNRLLDHSRPGGGGGGSLSWLGLGGFLLFWTRRRKAS